MKASKSEIFERDGWRCMNPHCAFPGQPTIQEYGPLHPRAPEIGHEPPESRGGTDADRRCEHRHCNRLKYNFLDEELSTFPLGEDPIDIVAFYGATARHLAGSRATSETTAGRKSNGGLIGGLIGGRRYFELYGSPATPEGCREGGHTTNDAEHRADSNYVEARREGGRTTNDAEHRTNPTYIKARRENGRIGGPIGHHIRWHVARGIFNPKCNLCLEVYAFRSDFHC